ncbi:MAG: redoxin domain-containing protein, partial [Flavobacteriaceae bacterium]|nr:redoxin domain-containing protein [Flavobacteriaceae bacterium]
MFYSFSIFFYQGFTFYHFGLLLASLVPLFFFTSLYLFSIPRTSKTLLPITLIIFLALIPIFTYQYSSVLELVIGILLFLGWILYLYWYSQFDKRKINLSLKTPLPAYILQSVDNQSITPAFFYGNPVLYLFYRGNWCPLCMAQIKEIATQYKTLSQSGVQIVLISSQSQSHIQSLANKYSLPFYFLRDTGGEYAKKLNIWQKKGTPFGFEIMGYQADTVFPTLIITDAKGLVQFIHETD